MTKNMGSSRMTVQSVCLSIYCSLMLTSLIAGRANVRLAAMGGAADRIQNGALQELSSSSNGTFAGSQTGTLPSSLPTVRPAALRTVSAISLHDLGTVVRAKGKDDSEGPAVARLLGLGDQQIPVKQVIKPVSGELHGAEALTVNGKDYILFARNVGDDNWLVLVDEAESICKGFHGRTHAGIQAMPKDEAALMAAGEKGIWFQWMADGANVPAPSKS